MRNVRFKLTNPALLNLTAAQAVTKVGNEILRDTVSLCPVDTQNLAGSYTIGYDLGGTRASVVVGTNVEYAPYVEFGHGEITPKNGKFLRFEIGGKVVYTKRVKAQPPQPHLGPALDRAVRKYR